MFEENLAIANDDFFLHFSIPIEIKPSNQPSRIIEAIFDDDFIDIGNDAIIASNAPQVTCKSKDVMDLQMDDEVIINNQTYHIREIQPDSTGLTVYLLYESSTNTNPTARNDTAP